jgi:hypothetical protein
MTALTRRHPERTDCWHVYYGDVHVGAIARRTGCARSTSIRGNGAAASIRAWSRDRADAAPQPISMGTADFEAAWRRILPTLTEANFQEWHDQRDWTAKKYANVGARRTDAVTETKLNDALCLR